MGDPAAALPRLGPLDSLARLVLHHRAYPLAAPVPAPPANEPVVRLAQKLREDAQHLATLLDRSGGPPVVVVVDQFEEVFTLCDDEKAAKAFIDNLVELVWTDAGGPDLRLMSSLNDVSGIPTEGKNLIIVAAVNHVLHFRIFDGDGKVVVDTDEKRQTEQTWPTIEDLRKQLESLWPPCEMTRSDKGWVVTAVTSIVDHAHAGASPKNRVILTMRSDYEVYVRKYPMLRLLFDSGRVTVTYMEREELREAIERPAQQVGLIFENGVVDALLKDAFAEPGALPLLQFALLRLWEDRWHNKVTMKAYRRLGGYREALRTTADKLYDSMTYEYQPVARRIFLRIVRPSEGLEVTNRRILLKDLFPPHEDHERIRNVLNMLKKARLVRISGGSQAWKAETEEIKPEEIHEKDIQVEVAMKRCSQWAELGDWLSEQRAAIVLRQRLESKVAEWVHWGRGSSALLDEAQLREAQRWPNSVDEVELGVIPDLKDLIEASRKALKETEQRGGTGTSPLHVN